MREGLFCEESNSDPQTSHVKHRCSVLCPTAVVEGKGVRKQIGTDS